MKKIIILSAIILSALVSCSTDDEQTFSQESKIKKSYNETDNDFRIKTSDSLNRSATDSINGSVNPKPIKP